MDLDNLISVLGGAIGAGALGKLFEKWLDSKKRTDIKRTLRDFSYINSALNEIITNTSAEIVLVMETHDGGKPISPASKVFSSCLYEKSKPPFRNIKPELQNVLMSIGQINAVLSAAEGEPSVFFKSDPGDQGIIDMFKNNDWYMATTYCIYKVSLSKFFYMVIGTRELKDSFSDSELFLMIRNIEIIARVLKKYNQ